MKAVLIMISILLNGCGINKITHNKVSTIDQYKAAETQYKSGRFAAAKLGFESVLENNPAHIQAHFLLGKIALNEAQLDKAKMHFEAILEKDKRHASSHYHLGVIYLMHSERYFEYFTATTTQKETNPRLLKLLESINKFSVEQTQTEASLDALSDLLSDDRSQ